MTSLFRHFGKDLEEAKEEAILWNSVQNPDMVACLECFRSNWQTWFAGAEETPDRQEQGGQLMANVLILKTETVHTYGRCRSFYICKQKTDGQIGNFKSERNNLLVLNLHLPVKTG